MQGKKRGGQRRRPTPSSSKVAQVDHFSRKPSSRGEKIGKQLKNVAAEKSKKHIERRINSLPKIRRHLLAWIALLLFITIGLSVQAAQLRLFHTSDQARSGGTFVEGYLGSINNLNPIFSRSPAEVAAGELMFAKLYERDEDSKLVPRLASGYSASDDGTQLVVKLRDGLTWSDNQPLTSADVAFTLRHVQHPDAQSKYKQAWDNVTVSVVDELTLILEIDTPNPQFADVLELPVIPRHVLEGIPSATIRAADFSQRPTVFSGLFGLRESDVDGQRHRLLFEPSGLDWQPQPNIAFYIIDSYIQEETLAQAFADRKLTAIAPSFYTDLASYDIDPEDFTRYRYRSTSVAYSFYNSSDQFLQSRSLRRALALQTNTAAITSGEDWAYGSNSPVSPFFGLAGLPTQLSHDPAAARAELESSDEFEFVNGVLQLRQAAPEGDEENTEVTLRPVELAITVGELPNLRQATEALAEQWRELGITVTVNATDGINLVQNILPGRNYQVLVHPIDLGTNADIYSYWHSSQSRLQGYNFANYKSTAADINLSDASTIVDSQLARVKLQKFLETWREDAPATALGGLYIERYAQDGIELRDDILVDQPQDLLRYADEIALKRGLEATIENR